MQSALFFLLALAAGTCMTAQTGINARLEQWAGSPLLASLISFAVGTVALVGVCLAANITWPSLSSAGETRWHHWTGGLLGAFLVTVSVYLAPRLGAGTLIVLVVAGMTLSAMVFDHFGLIGFEVRPASLPRLAGAALLIAGVVLVRRF